MADAEVTLISSDGESFKVSRAVADESDTVKNTLCETGDDELVPLPNVKSRTLGKVIEYCKFHVEAREKNDAGKTAKTEDEVAAWDKDFVNVEQSQLFEIILAANYMDIKSLLQVTCQAVADMMTGKSPEELRKTFSIVNDFTPEEEEIVRRENQWAFD